MAPRWRSHPHVYRPHEVQGIRETQQDTALSLKFSEDGWFPHFDAVVPAEPDNLPPGVIEQVAATLGHDVPGDLPAIPVAVDPDAPATAVAGGEIEGETEVGLGAEGGAKPEEDGATGPSPWATAAAAVAGQALGTAAAGAIAPGAVTEAAGGTLGQAAATMAVGFFSPSPRPQTGGGGGAGSQRLPAASSSRTTTGWSRQMVVLEAQEGWG